MNIYIINISIQIHEITVIKTTISIIPQCGWTALMWACYRGHSLVVSELLERGATPNVKADVSVCVCVFVYDVLKF